MLSTFMGSPEASGEDKSLKLLDMVRNVDVYEDRIKKLLEEQDRLKELTGAHNTLVKAEKVLQEAADLKVEASDILDKARSDAEAIIKEAEERAATVDAENGEARGKIKRLKAETVTAHRLADEALAAAKKLQSNCDRKIKEVEKRLKETKALQSKTKEDADRLTSALDAVTK